MYFDWDYAAAEVEFKRAIALSSNSASIRMWYGWYLALMRRFDESLEELIAAKRLDPLSGPNINAIGVVYHWSGQTERAIAQFQNVLELIPNYTVTLSFLAEAYERNGDMASAIATIERIQPSAMDPQALSVIGYVYAKAGDSEKALAVLKDIAERFDTANAPAINCAQIYAGLGDHEQALNWLEKACEQRTAWLPFMKVDIKFDEMRTDPRFQAVLKRIGFQD